MENFLKKRLITVAEEYERGKTLRDDSEVEIAIIEKDIWVCDYSEIRGSAVPVVKVCEAKELSREDIINICDEHEWAYCL